MRRIFEISVASFRIYYMGYSPLILDYYNYIKYGIELEGVKV